MKSKNFTNPTIAICSNYGWTIYNFRMPLIRRLKFEGYRVVVFTQFDGYENQIKEEVDVIEPLFLSRKGVNPIIDFITAVDLTRLLLKFRPNVLLTFSIKPVIYGSISAKILGIKTISMITGLGTVFIKESWVTHVVKTLYRSALSSVPIIFFQNNDDRDIFLRNNLVEKAVCRFSPGSGVDVSKFFYSPPPLNSEFTILLIARMLWDKGIREYIEASKLIKRDYPAVRFQLLGPLGVQNHTSITREEVEHWQQNGIVEYLGETDDVTGFIEKACCVVLPSYREGTPRALLEAAAMGRPIITTDVPGCREVVSDGENGFICKPKDYLDLAQKIELMLRLPYTERKLMGIKGRKKIVATFRQELVCDLYIEAIASCLD